jgi:hypothetical protein
MEVSTRTPALHVLAGISVVILVATTQANIINVIPASQFQSLTLQTLDGQTDVSSMHDADVVIHLYNESDVAQVYMYNELLVRVRFCHLQTTSSHG